MHFWDEYTALLEEPETLDELCSFYDAQEIPLKIRYYFRDLIDSQMVLCDSEMDMTAEEFVRELERRFKTLPNFERHQLSWFKKLLATRYKHKPGDLLNRFQLCYDKEHELVDREKGRMAETAAAAASSPGTTLTPDYEIENSETPETFRRQNDTEISRLKTETDIFKKYLGSVASDVFHKLHSLRSALEISPEEHDECNELEQTINKYGYPDYKLFAQLGEKVKRFKSCRLLEGLDKDLNDWDYERKRSFIGFPAKVELRDVKEAAKDVQTILSNVTNCVKYLDKMESYGRGHVVPSEDHINKFRADIDNLQLRLFFITCRFEPTIYKERTLDQTPILHYKSRYPLRASIFSAIDTSIKVNNVSVNILTEQEAENIRSLKPVKNLPTKTDPIIGVISGNKIPEDPPAGRKVPKSRKLADSNITIAPDSHLFADFHYLQLLPLEGRRKGKKASESQFVTDDRYYLFVQFNITLEGREYHIWRVSTPIVISSHVSQDWRSWGNILWTYGDLSLQESQDQPKSLVIKKSRNWNELISILDKFYFKFTGSHLGSMQRNHLAKTGTRNDKGTTKLIDTYADMCKEKLDEERKFSFWDWFFNSLTLVKMFPLNTEHIFHGFISKEDAKELLTTKQNSTFLLRFRDSKPGSLSFAYINRGEVMYAIAQMPSDSSQVFNLESYIRNTANLIYMYPDIHKNTLEYTPKSEKKQVDVDKPYYKRFQPTFRIQTYEVDASSSSYTNGSGRKSPKNTPQEIERLITYEDFCGTIVYLDQNYSPYPSPPYSEPELSNVMDFDFGLL